MENMVLQAKKGVDIQEASGMSFKNIKLITTDTKPVIDIVQSDRLSFDNISYPDQTELLFRVSGDRSDGITVKNMELNKPKERISYELGASKSAVRVIQ
jgi:hypothetical protein